MKIDNKKIEKVKNEIRQILTKNNASAVESSRALNGILYEIKFLIEEEIKGVLDKWLEEMS